MANDCSIITSATEHKSMRMAIEMLEPYVDIIYVEPEINNQISAKTVIENCRDDTIFINIISANNETGVVNSDIPKIAQFAKDNGIFFNSDITQYIGNYISFTQFLDGFLFSAHKFGGSKGVGILYLPKLLANILSNYPFIFGSQQNYMRGGTINVAGNFKMMWALLDSHIKRSIKNKRLEDMKADIENAIKDMSNSYKLIPIINQKVNTILISVIIPSLTSYDVIVNAFKTNNVILGNGSACEARGLTSNYMNLYIAGIKNFDSESNTIMYDNFIRISFGDDITTDGVNNLISALKMTAAMSLELVLTESQN